MYTGKKGKKKRGDQIELKLRVLSIRGPKAKVGMITVSVYRGKKRKKRRKKRGDQIELKLRALSTGAKIKKWG
jgi:hypothetical protein